jgi:surfeit locus 1 family protein
VVSLLAFGRLGMWQLHRADEKQALIDQFDSGQQQTVTLSAGNADNLPRYQRVELRGRYDGQHQVLLDNMPSERGQPGYRVLTPVALEQGGWLLVDRGWLPLGASRSGLPETRVGDNERLITGRLDDLPEPGVRLGDNAPADPAASWPRVLSFPRYEELARALDLPLQRRIVLLDASQPDGYERIWQAHFGFGPERHVAYAAQWFALGAAALVIYLMMSFKRDNAG